MNNIAKRFNISAEFLIYVYIICSPILDIVSFIHRTYILKNPSATSISAPLRVLLLGIISLIVLFKSSKVRKSIYVFTSFYIYIIWSFAYFSI